MSSIAGFRKLTATEGMRDEPRLFTLGLRALISPQRLTTIDPTAAPTMPKSPGPSSSPPQVRGGVDSAGDSPERRSPEP